VDGVARSTNVEYYARIVKDHVARRSLVAEGTRLVDAAYTATDSPGRSCRSDRDGPGSGPAARGQHHFGP
jgi:hypothetical protein